LGDLILLPGISLLFCFTPLPWLLNISLQLGGTVTTPLFSACSTNFRVAKAIIRQRFDPSFFATVSICFSQFAGIRTGTGVVNTFDMMEGYQAGPELSSKLD
jgi:hypothetical protein